MGFLRRRRNKRAGQRGAVAVEFALSLFLLIPLLLGTLDYGYYFWVALHAVEAANAGARAGAPAIVSTADCSNPGAAAAAATAAVNAEMAKTLLPVPSWTVLPGRTTQGCQIVSTVPCWGVQVEVHFSPPVAFMLPFMPASSAAGMTRFTTKTVIVPK
jgi:Flp pilus assembly protein TadG